MIDQDRYRELLEEERSRLSEIRDSLRATAEEVEREPIGDPSSGGHIGDAGSELFERSRDLSIIQNVDSQLTDVGHALGRLSNGTYGTCEACGRPIDPARLDARPAARFCLADQRTAEREVHAR
jgi:DnaK suppressor protein